MAGVSGRAPQGDRQVEWYRRVFSNALSLSSEAKRFLFCYAVRDSNPHNGRLYQEQKENLQYKRRRIMDYNKTINLPKTDFPMRAGLPKREPEMLKRWQE